MRATLLRSWWLWATLLVGGAVAILVIAGGAGGDGGNPGPSPSASASAPVEQRTLLIQVLNDDGLGADNVIVGVNGGLPAAQVLVPSRLVVDPTGSAPETLARTANRLDRSSSQNALRDLLALRIDGTLSLARLALAGMVDFVGGITVDVDATITTVDESTGQKVVVVPAGSQHLAGTQAAEFALAWLPGEPETARLHRWSVVLTATVSALPEDRLRIEAMLTSLGGSARTTVSTSQVADFLLRMRAQVLAGDQQVHVLPTLPEPSASASGGPTSGSTAGTGSGSPTALAVPSATPSGVATEPVPVASGAPERLTLVRLDLPAAQQLLEKVLPTALLGRAEAAPRILLQDGVGQAGLSAAARADLASAGFLVVEGGNAAELGQSLTRITVGQGSDAAEIGAEVADALGVPGSQVESTSEPVPGADAVVTLGSDYADRADE